MLRTISVYVDQKWDYVMITLGKPVRLFQGYFQFATYLNIFARAVIVIYAYLVQFHFTLIFSDNTLWGLSF